MIAGPGRCAAGASGGITGLDSGRRGLRLARRAPQRARLRGRWPHACSGRAPSAADAVSGVGFGCLTCEFIFESADYRRLNCRGRGPNKLTHLLELGHDGLALDAELFREFVNPDLRHYAPSTRPGLLPGLPAGRGSACSVRRQLVLFIAACSSGAHCKSAFSRPVPPAVGTAYHTPSTPLLAG